MLVPKIYRKSQEIRLSVVSIQNTLRIQLTSFNRRWKIRRNLCPNTIEIDKTLEPGKATHPLQKYEISWSRILIGNTKETSLKKIDCHSRFPKLYFKRNKRGKKSTTHSEPTIKAILVKGMQAKKVLTTSTSICKWMPTRAQQPEILVKKSHLRTSQ